jgi:hypothetical protein
VAYSASNNRWIRTQAEEEPTQTENNKDKIFLMSEQSSATSATSAVQAVASAIAMAREPAGPSPDDGQTSLNVED